MGVGTEPAEMADDGVDVIAQAEIRGGQRHLAGVAPFGDVHLVIGQEGLTVPRSSVA